MSSVNYLGSVPDIPFLSPEERNGFDLYLTNQQDENTMYAMIMYVYIHSVHLLIWGATHNWLKEVYMVFSPKIHANVDGLLNDDENLNWNNASMVLSECLLVSISKYGNFYQ